MAQSRCCGTTWPSAAPTASRATLTHCPFDDLGSRSQEPSARAGQGMVAEDVDKPAASGRGAAPIWTEGGWEA